METNKKSGKTQVYEALELLKQQMSQNTASENPETLKTGEETEIAEEKIKKEIKKVSVQIKKEISTEDEPSENINPENSFQEERKKAEPQKKRHRGPHKATQRTVKYVDLSGNTLSTFCLVDEATGITHYLKEERTTIGKSEDADIILNDNYVSRKHAILTIEDGAFFIEDAGSTNGTKVKGNMIEKKTGIELGERIVIGQTRLILTALSESQKLPQEDEKPKEPEAKKANVLSLVREDTGEIYILDKDITVGRDINNDISIPDPIGHFVSSRHASIFLQGKDTRLKDEGSSNGTYVNGTKIKSRILREGDTVKFGDIEFAVVKGS